MLHMMYVFAPILIFVVCCVIGYIVASRHVSACKRAIAIKPQIVAPQQDYCLGCDQIRPPAWMRFTEANEYRCRTCRGEPDPALEQERKRETFVKFFLADSYVRSKSPIDLGEALKNYSEDRQLVANVDELHYRNMLRAKYGMDKPPLAAYDSGELSRSAAYANLVQRKRDREERRATNAPRGGEQIQSSGHWEWTGMGREWIVDRLDVRYPNE